MSKEIKNKIVPKLRFPEFKDADEWEELQFGELDLDVSDGNYSSKYPTQSDFLKIGIPFLRANNLKFGTVSDEDIRFISEKQHNEITKGHLKRGDILLSTRGEIGTVALVPNRHIGSNINAQLVRINTCEKIVNTFLFQSLDFLRANGLFDSLSTGTALKQLPIGKLNQLEIWIPKSKGEQQKIADCLSSLDELITAQSQKLQALKAHKRGLMQQLFPAEGETVPKLRFAEFRDSGEWEEKIIGKIAKVTTGNKDTQDKVANGLYPFFVRSQTIEHIDSYSYDGEAILTSGDGVGVGKNFHYINGKFNFHQRVYCIYDFNENISGQFIYLYFSEHFYKRVMKMNAKNSVDSVRMAMITEMPIFLPSLAEQQKIADCLSSLDEQITAQTEKIEALKTHKKGLMQALFPQLNEAVNA